MRYYCYQIPSLVDDFVNISRARRCKWQAAWCGGLSCAICITYSYLCTCCYLANNKFKHMLNFLSFQLLPKKWNSDSKVTAFPDHYQIALLFFSFGNSLHHRHNHSKCILFLNAAVIHSSPQRSQAKLCLPCLVKMSFV